MKADLRPDPAEQPVEHAAGLLERAARGLVLKRLARLERGGLVLVDSQGRTQLGQGGDLHATIRVRRGRLYRRALAGGNLGVAAAYLDGDWDCDDLTNLFRLFLRNADQNTGLDGLLAWATRLGAWWRHCWRRNTPEGSQSNIRRHYDLGNDFFRLWLDDTWSYSSAVFPTQQATLAEGSREKLDRVCRKLDLRPQDHLLEIGTGWGGLALHAAAHYGCRVTTATISREQHDLARQRVTDAGLERRVTVLLRDYRDLTGQYDKLVSIEMIEAVGHEFLNGYFKKCGELLKPEGTFLLQSIVMPERGYRNYLRRADFIQRYIFPGGCLPSASKLVESAGQAGRLRMVHAEDLAPHYAETLRRWRSNFHEQRAAIRRLGYPARFLRLWHYYLCYCEAAFEERHTGVVQMQFDGPLCRRDPVQITSNAALTQTRDSNTDGDSSRGLASLQQGYPAEMQP
jgi:cyclopropane-fatty-acyl-phospholipid synthase